MSITVMGVDLGIHKVAWSIWTYDVVYGEVLNEVHDVEHIGYRPTELYELSTDVAARAHWWEVDSVWIEDTLVGNNTKYSIQLSQTMGAVQSQLAAHYRHKGAGIYTINVGTWKKKICGNGHATKDDIRYTLEQVNPEYARACDRIDGDELQYRVPIQDRYDAALIGLYGLRISRTVEDDLDLADPRRTPRKGRG